MNDLEFYKQLKSLLPNINIKDAASILIREELVKRIKELEDKDKQIKQEYWYKLCNLIESTVRNYERDNSKYLDITVDVEGNSIITITNNLI